MNPYWAYGFGVDVPVTTPSGDLKQVPVTEGTNCGDPRVVQRMLSDLGYDAGGSSGQFNNTTLASIKKAAADLNVSAGGLYPSGPFCTKLANAWAAKRAAAKAATSTPTSTSKPETTQKSATTPARQEGTSPAPNLAPKGWWDDLSTTAKVGIGVGALALLGGAAYFFLRKAPAKATPNKRRRRRPCSCVGPCACARANMAAAKRPTTCRKSRPKGYPTDKSLYALPECWMYPLDSKKHVRAAASRFGKYKRRYSPEARAKIAAAIDRAERRYGIGKYH